MKYKPRLIVERKVDKVKGWIEILECGHIHLMSKNDKRSFPTLGKVIRPLSSRYCFECAKAEAAR